jgi:hypothetical protein
MGESLYRTLFYKGLIEKGLIVKKQQVVPPSYMRCTDVIYKVAPGIEGSTNGFVGRLRLVVALPRFSTVLGIQQTDKTATVEAELEYALTETGKRYIEVLKSIQVPGTLDGFVFTATGDTVSPNSPQKIVQRYAFTKWDDGWRLGEAR